MECARERWGGSGGGVGERTRCWRGLRVWGPDVQGRADAGVQSYKVLLGATGHT